MAKSYVEWEELFVSNDKGRRIVQYYLKDSDGGSDLAVVGKEKSPRHMVYTVLSQFLRLADTNGIKSPLLKWRSRREVVDWLSSWTTDSHSCESSPLDDRSFEDKDASRSDFPGSKGLSSRKSKPHSKDFSWLGSAWTCRKRRWHYQSFSRNGITISVHDFVYVISEENRKLVAYLEDLYEDSRGNKMVVARWFHKIDEVDIILPPNFNDREIFFSLCLQDFSVECIDGLATILGPQHFEKFLNEATHTLWEPYLCHRQIDNNDVKPFDITQVQGYWNQRILRYMYTSSSRNSSNPSRSYNLEEDGKWSKPKRKHGWRNEVLDLRHKGDAKETALGTEKLNAVAVTSKAERCVPIGGSAVCLKKEKVNEQTPQQRFSAGCLVEVLSQDSGIRGCWFRAVILKRHEQKVKVQYQDVKDAEETGNLEEWILASRVASPDELGIRFCGRTIVRPHPPPKAEVSFLFDVGTSVDAWWHDGWWEGIVIRNESKDKIHVYFQGEHRTSVFNCESLRPSQDWVSNKWNCIRDRPDLVNLIPSKQDCPGVEKPSFSGRLFQPVENEKQCVSTTDLETAVLSSSPMDDNPLCRNSPRSDVMAEKKAMEVPNLARDYPLIHLRWNSSKKRRRGRERFARGSTISKRHGEGGSSGSSGSSSREDGDSPTHDCFVIPKPMKVDHDVCKYAGDALFIPSMQPLSSMVMSR